MFVIRTEVISDRLNTMRTLFDKKELRFKERNTQRQQYEAEQEQRRADRKDDR